MSLKVARWLLIGAGEFAQYLADQLQQPAYQPSFYELNLNRASDLTDNIFYYNRLQLDTAALFRLMVRLDASYRRFKTLKILYSIRRLYQENITRRQALQKVAELSRSALELDYEPENSFCYILL